MLSKRLACFTCAALVSGCVFAVTSAVASAATTLNGSGSTLVAPIEAEWAAAWDSATGNTVNYNPVGSTKGYNQVATGFTDFGGSDAPLSVYSSPACAPQEGGCVQIPWALTATGVSFHINGIRKLHLSGPVLANIYLGHITNWDAPQIKRLNKKVHLPNLPISVFYRSDGSGDTYAFTRYLSDVSPSFASQVGSSTTVRFPTGTGCHANSGMASCVQGTNGGIAYIAVSYIINDGLPAAGIRNASGRFAVPNLSAIEAAAKVVHSVPSNNQLTIVNPPRRAASGYPISTYTYAIVPRRAPQGSTIRSFIYYALTQGQLFAPRLDFAPLPSQVKAAGINTLNQIQ